MTEVTVTAFNAGYVSVIGRVGDAAYELQVQCESHDGNEWVIVRDKKGWGTRPTRAEAIGVAVTIAIAWAAEETAEQWKKKEEV